MPRKLPVGLIWITLLGSLTNAQTPSKSPQTKTTDPEFEQRRVIAMSLLQSLAIEARSYHDEPLRARVQARIADVLWDRDRDGARALFRRAWEAAEAIEQSGESSNPGARQPTTRPTQARRNLRREVLQLVARHDHTLAEEFLARMTAKDPTEPKTEAARVSSAEIAERLRLANEFLAAGNTDRALQFAGPVLSRVSQGVIEFLVNLRDKDARAADRRFAALLWTTTADDTSDANTISLLTSYVFTPWIYLVVSRTGIPSSTGYQPRRPPEIAPSLRESFLDVATRILLRPLTQVDQSSAGRAGTHFIATRLLPLYQQFAPHLLPAINAQLAAMGPDAARTTENAGAASLNRGMNSESGRDPGDNELKERLDRAKNSNERDRAYSFAAMRAADAGDLRANDFVDKIENSDTRKGVGTFVAYSLIRSLLRKEQTVEALLLIRKSDIPRTLRAQFLTQSATLTLKTDRVRSLELFEEALADTRRIDAGTAERAYCLIAILRHYSKLDRTRTWELLSETIKAANGVAGFTGENGQTSVSLEGAFSIRMSTELASPSDLSETFVNLSHESFYQAIDMSKTFTGDAPRALSTIAIARAVLIEKPARK